MCSILGMFLLKCYYSTKAPLKHVFKQVEVDTVKSTISPSAEIHTSPKRYFTANEDQLLPKINCKM